MVLGPLQYAGQVLPNWQTLVFELQRRNFPVRLFLLGSHTTGRTSDEEALARWLTHLDTGDNIDGHLKR